MTDKAIEAAAEAMYLDRHSAEHRPMALDTWDHMPPSVRDPYISNARAAVVAFLKACADQEDAEANQPYAEGLAQRLHKDGLAKILRAKATRLEANVDE